jgi:integrase
VDHKVVESTPKSGRSRRIALDPTTVAALRSWKRAQAAERLTLGGPWPGEDHIFTWADGTVVHPDVVTRTFGRAVAAAGVPPLRLHNLRHTWATHALDAGVDVKEVSTRLGHSSTRITYDIYVAALPERDQAAAVTVADIYDAGPDRCT